MLLVLVLAATKSASAANILLLPSTAYTDTLQSSLRTALTTDGHTATVAPVDELAWDGTNPPTSGFDVIVHLAGVPRQNVIQSPASSTHWVESPQSSSPAKRSSSTLTARRAARRGMS